MKVGQRIKKLRELKDFSQQYMAEKLDIKQQTYSKMESGDIDFPVSRLPNIAKVFGMRIADIFLFDEQTIFNSYHYYTAENNNNTGAGHILRDDKLLEQLKQQYETRLTEKDKEIERLHTLLEKSLTQ